MRTVRNAFPPQNGEFGEVEVLGVLLRDQHRRDDVGRRQLLALQARLAGHLDRVVHELGRVGDVGLDQRVAAVHQRLDRALGAGAAEHQLDVLALGLLDGLEHAHGHVVVGGPDRVDLLEARQEVLHHLEGVVAVPVAVLGVQQLDAGMVLHHGVEGVHALVVERGRDAAQRHDVALAVQRLGDVLAGTLPKAVLSPDT
jgi:hypothetical protein